jgi:hypothetical protein
MKIVDIRFLGGKQSIKLLAFRRKPMEMEITTNGSTSNPTLGLFQTATAIAEGRSQAGTDDFKGLRKGNSDDSKLSALGGRPKVNDMSDV